MDNVYYPTNNTPIMNHIDYDLQYNNNQSPTFNKPFYSPNLPQFQEVLPMDIYYLNNNTSQATTLLIENSNENNSFNTPRLNYISKVQSPNNINYPFPSPHVDNPYFNLSNHFVDRSSSSSNAPKTTIILNSNNHPNDNNYYYTISTNNNNNNNLIEDCRGRAENWTYEETSQFLKVLIKYQKEFENICRNQNLWKTIIKELNSYGYQRTIEKCKNRWKVLVAKYKKCEEKLRKGFVLDDDNTNNGFEFYWDLKLLLGNSYVFDRSGKVKRLKKKQKLRIQNHPVSLIHLRSYEELNLT